MKKKIVYFLVLALLLGTMSGCGLDKNKVDNDENTEDVVDEIDYTPEIGGEITLPLTTFNTLNPLMTENSSYYYFSKLIFEGLFEFDENLNTSNQLAEKYEIKDSGRTIDIKLKDDIYWHDGEKLTSQDVAFTVNTIKYANANNVYKEMFEQSIGSFSPSDIRRIVEVNVIDDTNLVINFDRQFSNNLEVLTFPIIPSHVFNTGGGNSYVKALQIEDYKPIGTGPFKFEKYDKMKQIELVANEDFRGSRPYIDKIVGKVFDSQEDILQAFETREVNMATTIGVDWDKYTQEDTIRSVEFISSNYEFLGFNFNKDIFSDETGIDIRRAITYAIDRQGIIEKVYLGHGTQIDVPIHPNSWLLSEEANQYGYNLDMAKEELEKLNLKDSNKDGILEIDGKNISLTLLTNTFNPLRLKTAKLIKEDLKKIGIQVEIYPEPIEEGKEASKEDIEKQWTEINEEIADGNYDMVLIGWKLSVIPDLSFAFHSSQIKSGTNFINYSNEAMDNTLEKAFLSGIRESKKESYSELQKLIVEEIPYSSLLFKNKSLLLDSKIMGDLEPSFFNPYKGIENVYIPKDLQ